MAAVPGWFDVVHPRRADQFLIVGKESWVGGKVNKKVPREAFVCKITTQLAKVSIKESFIFMGKLVFSWPRLAIKIRTEQMKRGKAAKVLHDTKTRKLRAPAKRAALMPAGKARAKAKGKAVAKALAAPAAMAAAAAPKLMAAPKAKAMPRVARTRLPVIQAFGAPAAPIEPMFVD